MGVLVLVSGSETSNTNNGKLRDQSDGSGSFPLSDVSFTSKNPRVSIGYSLALVSAFSDLPSACPSLMIPVLTDYPLSSISPFSSPVLWQHRPGKIHQQLL